MILNDLLKEQNMTRAELSLRSSVPESTLRDILNGKARLERCEALTLYCIAAVLDTTVDELLEAYWDESENPATTCQSVHDGDSLMSFYLLVASMLHKLYVDGDVGFVNSIRQSQWIERMYSRGLYRNALFLLGLTDHICKKHGMRMDQRYDAYRCVRLDRPVYALRTLEENDDSGAFEKARLHAEAYAIPELGRFNIHMTSDDIRPQM